MPRERSEIPKKRGTKYRKYKIDLCKCGSVATDRHHIDGDCSNDVIENIVGLCRKCHMEADGRLEEVKNRMKEISKLNVTPPVPCSVCGTIAKPTRKGKCNMCSMFFTRNGFDRPKTVGYLKGVKNKPAGYTKEMRANAAR